MDELNEKIKEENELRWQVLFSEVRAYNRKEKIKKIYGINC